MSIPGNELGIKLERIKSAIATFPDFPKQGILFYDIMPVFKNPSIFQDVLSVLSAKLASCGQVDAILALESRGFLFGPTLALQNGIPFIPIRKKGKLPGPTQPMTYVLEYGEDTIEIQDGGIKTGSRVVILDDLLATGGTLGAAVTLVQKCGGIVVCSMVIIELPALKGKERVESPFYSMIQF